jgi:hypothetical protein
VTLSLPPPTQAVTTVNDGLITHPWYRIFSQLFTAVNQAVRTVFTGGKTFYVDGTTGSDDTGTGSINNPFATPQAAYDHIAENVDGGGNWVRIFIADGTYEMQTTVRTNVHQGETETAVMVMDRQLAAVSAIIIEGESEGGVIFNGFGVLHNTDGFVRFRNIKFESPSIANCRGIFARAPGATIGILDGCEWGTFLDTNASTCAMQYYGAGIIKIFSPITISGSMHRFVFLESGSGLDWEDLTTQGDGSIPWCTFVGTPAIEYFLQCGAQSFASLLFLTFSGSFIGTKYVRSGGSIGIFPYEHPNSLIPGTIDGLERSWTNVGLDQNTGASPRWTPELRFGGSAVGITYNVERAHYMEVANMVFLHCTFNLSSKGAAVGDATIGGIPYEAANYGATLGYIGNVTYQNMTAPVGTWGTVTCNIDANGTEIELKNMPPAGTGNVAVTDAEFNNNSSVSLSIMYFKD